MASGRPDWHSIITISGKHDSNYIPVKLDDQGQLYIALTGQHIDIDNLPSDYFKEGENIGDVGAVSEIVSNVTVDQSDPDRVIVGKDGATPHYVAVDSAGVILARMKGAFGETLKDISVDTNGLMLARMTGIDGETLRTVKVDANGQMYIALTGQYIGVDNLPSDYFKQNEAVAIKEGEQIAVSNHPSDYFKEGESIGAVTSITENVTVDQAALNRRMEGKDGVTYRYIVVDGTGVMLARMKGAFGEVLKDIAVDTDGLMLSIMKGDFDGTLKTIAVDTDGIMKANLTAQDLDFLTVRPAYGQARTTSITKACPDSEATTMLTVAGRGVILGGEFMFNYGASALEMTPRLSLDGLLLMNNSISTLLARNYMFPECQPLSMMAADSVNNFWMVGLVRGYTFESECKLIIYNNTGLNRTCSAVLLYALVPE